MRECERYEAGSCAPNLSKRVDGGFYADKEGSEGARQHRSMLSTQGKELSTAARASLERRAARLMERDRQLRARIPGGQYTAAEQKAYSRTYGPLAVEESEDGLGDVVSFGGWDG